MKYYSSFTSEYVRDICNALNSAGYKVRGETFNPEDFKTLTEFLKNHVLYHSNIFEYLNQKGLVNRGKCPYTGQQIDKKSPNYSYFNRTIYMSPEGCKVMQREDDENYKELFGEAPPKRKEISSANKGCSVLFGIAVIVSICIFIFT